MAGAAAAAPAVPLGSAGACPANAWVIWLLPLACMRRASWAGHVSRTAGFFSRRCANYCLAEFVCAVLGVGAKAPASAADDNATTAAAVTQATRAVRLRACTNRVIAFTP